MRLGFIAPVVCVLLTGCGAPVPPTPLEVATSARTALAIDPAMAELIIKEAPADVQKDPEVQEILATAQRRAGMTPSERMQDEADGRLGRSMEAVKASSSGGVQTLEGAADVTSDFKQAALTLGWLEDKSPNAANAAKADALQKLLIARQVALYPKIRSTYAERLAYEIAAGGAYVEAVATGRKNKTLRMTSSAFISRDVIGVAYDSVAIRANSLRFTRAEFQPYLGGPVTSYKLRGKADDVVAPF